MSDSASYSNTSDLDDINDIELIMDNYYGKPYGKQYYHGEQLNASLMVSGLRCYTLVIGKITVVILVRDRCPRGKDLLRNSLSIDFLQWWVIERRGVVRIEMKGASGFLYSMVGGQGKEIRCQGLVVAVLEGLGR
ncbi:hypothetical protein Tco_0612751 [Tanacetum coccineum]